MRPGQLKRRIEIKRPTTTTDDQGGQEVTYTSLGMFYAKIRRGGGARGLQYEQTSFEKPFIITIRQNIEILETDLIEYEGISLTVSSIERDLDLKEYQVIIATSKVS